jgi:signal transduction histidine kinase
MHPTFRFTLARRWARAVPLALVLAFPPRAPGIPLALRPGETTAPLRPGHPLAAAVDGVLETGTGWSVSEGQLDEQLAVFTTAAPLDVALLRFQFLFRAAASNAAFSEFEVEVTSDKQPAAHGHWMPLIPEEVTADVDGAAHGVGPRVRTVAGRPLTEITFRARAPFDGITGFRLRLLPRRKTAEERRATASGGAREGTCLLTEMRVEAVPHRSSNLALGRQVYCSRPVADGLPSQNLTDGFYGTYTHPDPAGGDLEAFFELDLGRMVVLDHITVRGREADGSGAGLTAYRIELFAESGDAGQTQWRGTFSKPADGKRRRVDVIRARDGRGTFIARRIRLSNEGREADQPQVAELEVYPALFPRVAYWLVDDVTRPGRRELSLASSVRTVEFVIECGRFGRLADGVTYRWRMRGWQDAWQETGADGRVVWLELPPPGVYRLECQARHSDGVWDQSAQPLFVHILRPWWHDWKTLGGGTLGLLFAGAAVWWRVKATVMRRRLAAAEQRLDLQRERLRIARDMHDEMGARLTYLALLADRLRQSQNNGDPAQAAQLSELAESARDSVGALDAIVWAVSPKHDSLGDLADYLSDYAPTYLRPAGIECRLDLRVETPSLPLGLRLRHALIMAVKEALQNVARHSAATFAEVGLRQQGGQLEITICDDGRGLAGASAGATHSGLENMRQRLAEVGGECAWNPGTGGRGTCVRMTVPLPAAEPGRTPANPR